MKQINASLFKILLAGLLLSACRGTPSSKPPVHPNPNMDFGYQFEAQEENSFFEDTRAMRTPVEGTVARGFLADNPVLQEGKEANGAFVKRIPLTVNRAFIEHGQDKYQIFCSPCHGGLGDGKGMVVSRGLVPPPTYHSDVLRNVEDGYLFEVVTNGVRSMHGYKTQIPSIEDRWSIVAYLRALQKSQNASSTEYTSVIGTTTSHSTAAVN